MTHRLRRFLLAGFGVLALGLAGVTGPVEPVERCRAEAAGDRDTMNAWTALSDVYLWLARDTGDLNQIEQAESAVYHALYVDSTYTPSLNQLSRVLSAQHRFQDVLVVQNWSIVLDLKNAQSWGILGDAFMDLGKYRNADSCYHMMLELDPGFHSLLRIARWMVDIGDFDEAVDHFTKAIDTASNQSTPVVGSDSAETVREGLDVSVRDLSRAYTRLGKAYLSHGELDLAKEAAAASLDLLPGFVPAMCLEAEILRFERAFGGACRIYGELIEKSSDPRLKSALARVYADQRRHHRAEPLARQAADEFGELFDAFPKIVRRDYVEFLLEWDLNLETALSLAIEESRRRRDVYTYDVLAWAYFKNKKYDLAWSSIGFALRRGTTHPRILYHAAVIAKAAGKNDKHEKYSDRVRRLNPKFRRIYGSL